MRTVGGPPDWACERCAEDEEPCACGTHKTCPDTWDKAAILLRGELAHWPARLGGCRAARKGEEG